MKNPEFYKNIDGIDIWKVFDDASLEYRFFHIPHDYRVYFEVTYTDESVFDFEAIMNMNGKEELERVIDTEIKLSIKRLGEKNAV